MITPLDETIFDEASFAKILGFERKRTDRSQRPFLLVLLTLRTRPRGGQRQRATLVENVIQSLQLCVRQTDLLGWYKQNTVLGAIFTELHHESPATGKILERVNAALQARLTPNQRDTITISAHVYPQQDAGVSDAEDHDRLYPDLKQRTLADRLKRML